MGCLDSITIARVILVLSVCQLASGDVNTDIYNTIVRTLNNSHDPCENFYSYACGNYAEQHKSVNYQELSGFMDYQYNLELLALMSHLKSSSYQKHEQFQTVNDKSLMYFQSCLRETRRNLSRYLEEIPPGPQLTWPVYQLAGSAQWPSPHIFNVWQLLGKLQSHGLNNVLIHQEILVNGSGQLSLMMEPAYSENNSTLPALAMQKALLMFLGLKKPEKFLRSLTRSNKFLITLQQDYEINQLDTAELTYKDFQLLYPQLDEYVQELLGLAISSDSLMRLRNPSYFHYLNSHIGQALKAEDLCHYLMMKFILYLTLDASSQFNALTCLKDVRNKMDLAVNFLYYDQHYSKKSLQLSQNIQQIFLEIKAILSGLLENNNYLNLTYSQTQTIKAKLQNLRLNIGNLPAHSSSDKIAEFYSQLPFLDENNYYKNHLLLLRQRFHKSLNYAPKQSHFIVSDNKMGSSSAAFYVAKQNMIILPFGLISPPLYDMHLKAVFKYSLMGFILAHEAVHAIDITGLSYDATGKMLASKSDIIANENFQNSVQCLQSQLETDNMDERIADIVAIQILDQVHALKAHQQDRKYVYLNLAQLFCGQSNIEFVDHDADAERLNQIVMNSEHFATAFKCDVSRKMNPSKKCRLY